MPFAAPLLMQTLAGRAALGATDQKSVTPYHSLPPVVRAGKNRFSYGRFRANLTSSSTNAKEVIQCRERYWSEVSEQPRGYPARATSGSRNRVVDR
jgi:hypothetical protein